MNKEATVNVTTEKNPGKTSQAKTILEKQFAAVQNKGTTQGQKLQTQWHLETDLKKTTVPDVLKKIEGR